jgi:hypothetical protein
MPGFQEASIVNYINERDKSMTGFEKVNQEIEDFKKSSFYPLKYNDVIDILKNRPELRRLVLSSELERTLNLRGTSIRTIIKNARRLGEPIGSCGDGYFYARNYKEIESTIHHLAERRDSLTFTLKALLKTYPDAAQGKLF